MRSRVQALADRVRDELEQLARVISRANEALQRARESGQDLYLDATAFNLQGLYTGIEGIFESIARNIDGLPPTGAAWHQELLQSMAAERPGVRPAVITEATCAALDGYRRFRHVARHIYAFDIEPDRTQELADGASAVFAQVRAELLAFANFLDQSAQADP